MIIPQSFPPSHRKDVSRQPAAHKQNSDRLRAKYKVFDINFQDIKANYAARIP